MANDITQYKHVQGEIAELDQTNEFLNIFWKTKLFNFQGKPQISAWLDFHGSIS